MNLGSLPLKKIKDKTLSGKLSLISMIQYCREMFSLYLPEKLFKEAENFPEVAHIFISQWGVVSLLMHAG